MTSGELVQSDSDTPETPGSNGEGLKLTIRKCPMCRKLLTAATTARHIHEMHPNCLPRSSKDKKKRKAEMRDALK